MDYGLCSLNTTLNWRPLIKHQLDVKSNIADGTCQGQCSQTELRRAVIANLRTSTEMASRDMPSSAASSHSALFIWVAMLLEAAIKAFLYISSSSQSNHNLHTEQAFFSYYSKYLLLPPSLIKVTRQALFHQDTTRKIEFNGARERKTILFAIGKASKSD